MFVKQIVVRSQRIAKVFELGSKVESEGTVQDQGFDRLARGVASQRTRRGAMKTGIAGLGAMLGIGFAGRADAAAKRSDGETCRNGSQCVTGFCQVGSDGRRRCVNPNPCSAVAIAYCDNLNWNVAEWHTSFPNQPGGSIFCLPPGGFVANDCDLCDVYKQIVWSSSAVDASSSPSNLLPGHIYGGHPDCDLNELDECGTWDMQACIPD